MRKQFDEEDTYDMQEAREEYETERVSKQVEKRGVVPVNHTGFQEEEKLLRSKE